MGLASAAQRNRTGGRTIALLGLLVLLAISIAPVHAQADIVAEHTYTYSQTATFTLTFPAAAAPAAATLYLKVGTFTQPYATPVVNNVARQERNLSEAPFPPFTLISYWWAYQDAQRQTHTTKQQQFL